ncbi:MAG: choice-of-anchor D domain-containing protein [Myxococcota bacterium]
MNTQVYRESKTHRVLRQALPLVLVLSALPACNEPSVVLRDEPVWQSSPAIEVDPAAIDFGLARRTDLMRETVTVTNIGFADLELTDLELSGADSYALMGDPMPVTIAPGDAWTFEVQFTPVAAGTLGGVVTVVSDASNEKRVEVPIVGEGAVPELVIVPDPLDFGDQFVGCESGDAFTLANVGTETLNVTDARFFGDPAFSAVLPALPLQLEPGDSYDVPVSFIPSGETLGGSLLDVVADDPRGGLQVDVLGKGVYASTQTESFVVPEAQPVRILFAVDQSGSMSDQATALGSAFSSFINTVSAATGDWRIGVVTNDNGCFNSGVLTSSTPNVQSVFSNAVHGQDGALTERLLQLSDLALGASCNAGFGPIDAPLHMVMVSDESDQSSQSWTTYYNDWRTTEVSQPSLLTVHAIADINYVCGIGNGGDGPGGYLDIANASGGEVLDICNSGWSSQIASIAASAVADLNRYELQWGNVHVPSIEVMVNGQAVVKGWTWDATDNAVVFDEALGGGDQLEISYGLLPACP